MTQWLARVKQANGETFSLWSDELNELVAVVSLIVFNQADSYRSAEIFNKNNNLIGHINEEGSYRDLEDPDGRSKKTTVKL